MIALPFGMVRQVRRMRRLRPAGGMECGGGRAGGGGLRAIQYLSASRKPGRACWAAGLANLSSLGERFRLRIENLSDGEQQGWPRTINPRHPHFVDADTHASRPCIFQIDVELCGCAEPPEFPPKRFFITVLFRRSVFRAVLATQKIGSYNYAEKVGQLSGGNFLPLFPRFYFSFELYPRRFAEFSPRPISASHTDTPRSFPGSSTGGIPILSSAWRKISGGRGKKLKAAGWAYSGGGNGIVRVDVSADGGQTWQTAELAEGSHQNPHRSWAWTFWHIDLELPDRSAVGGGSSGEDDVVEICCKATDTNYNVQPERPEPIWNARGLNNTSWHRVKVKLEP